MNVKQVTTLVAVGAMVVVVCIGRNAHADQPKTAEEFLKKGEVAEKEKKREQAISDYTEAIRLDPKFAPAYINRGRVYALLRKFDSALADTTEAIRLDLTSDKAFNNRGFIHYRLGKHAEAVKDLTEALRLNPKFAEEKGLLKLRGAAYAELKEHDKAMADYLEHLRLHPRELLESDSFGTLLCFTKDESATAKDLYNKSIDDLREKAVTAYSNDIRQNPKEAEPHFLRGLLYAKLKKHARAIADFQDALRLNPMFGDTYGFEDSNLSTAGPQKQMENSIENLRKTGKKPKVLSVKLENELFGVNTKKSPVYKLPANTEKVIEDTVRVKHEVKVTDDWKAETEVRGSVTAWFVEVQESVREEISKSTSVTYGVETERKRSVTIKGGAERGIYAVWVDLYRPGKAKVELDGVTFELPFSFREDFDIITAEADPAGKK